MSHDMLMIRGEQKGSFNLAVGEPVFLQDAAFWCNAKTGLLIDPKYPPYGGDERLVELIRGQFKHAKKHIVVTNGAKQGLLAAFYAYKTRGYQPKSRVLFDAPYWPSYPTLAKLSGMSYGSTLNVPASSASDLTVITSPNNPDGSQSLKDCNIWDAAYQHWVYGAKGAPNAEVSVWSAAKMLGLSGLRLGIVTTDDADLADHMSAYVEKTTSGVANFSQNHLAEILEVFKISPDLVAKDYATARRTLLTNAEIFSSYISPFCSEVQGVPANGVGMFAWFKADYKRVNEASHAAGVKLIPGVACGAAGPVHPRSNGMGWWRMSLGHRNNYTEQACSKLASALEG